MPRTQSAPSGKKQRHPYLTGNFAPIHETCPLTPCRYSGTIPEELYGGQYIRNGSNPVSNEDLGREAHWFDGDGMLAGVCFARQTSEQVPVEPQFVNQYVLTDLYLSSASTPSLKKPILPSISTLVNPISSLFKICLVVLRTIFLVILSHLSGSQQAIKKISVANTSLVWHDGRALATCESGPPMRISLPSLKTVGWFNGNSAEGEPESNDTEQAAFGGTDRLSFFKEWTTAHPRVDPCTHEMILFHSTFVPPFVHYSVLPPAEDNSTSTSLKRLVNEPVSGICSAKMMHDFGVSRNHTVIMDLPLTLDPLQLAKNKPVIEYDSTKPARFGVFPRRDPTNPKWFETSACCIFHTANTWDVHDSSDKIMSVDMLACRMNTASIVFAAGNIGAPQPTNKTIEEVKSYMEKRPGTRRSSGFSRYDSSTFLEAGTDELTPLLRDTTDVMSENTNQNDEMEEDQCRLYYFSFPFCSADNDSIAHQFGLSAIPFEFPSVRPDREMSEARFIYGCSTISGTFNPALGRASNVDALVKIDAKRLIERGKTLSSLKKTECVDNRSMAEILASGNKSSGPEDELDCIQVFRTPSQTYAQEPRFVPCRNGTTEDSGYLLAYMFDESQLTAEGDPPPSAVSELWIIDAKGMKDVLAKVHLPQRVPYGLHGCWFPEWQVLGQRAIEQTREIQNGAGNWQLRQRIGKKVINGLIGVIGG